jgi:hypothetical protein
MIDTFYDNAVIKTKYDGTDGSGVLFQTDDCSFTYLITAWHCLNSNKVIDATLLSIFRQELGNMKNLDISIKDYLIIEEKDIVIIKIDYISDVKLNFATSVVVGDDVDITGFPIAMAAESSQVKRFPLGASIASIPDADRVVMISKLPLDTYGKPPKDVVSSCSGSGIFKKLDDQIFLCGIVTDLGETEGAFGALVGISLECLINGLKENGWEVLCDLESCTFNHYQEGTIEIFEDQLKRICTVQMKNVRENVLPSDIKNKCGKKLVWPYSTTKLHNKNIWEGWLLYLIIRSIENKDNMKDEKFYVINSTERKVKLIYVRNKTTLSDFLKEYLENAYADIKNGDYLIIKTDKVPARKILNRSQIDKIVTDVSNAICIKEELYIDDVKSDTRKLSMIHIEKMVDDLNAIIDGFDDDAIGDKVLEEKLGERIGEMLNEL